SVHGSRPIATVARDRAVTKGPRPEDGPDAGSPTAEKVIAKTVGGSLVARDRAVRDRQMDRPSVDAAAAPLLVPVAAGVAADRAVCDVEVSGASIYAAAVLIATDRPVSGDAAVTNGNVGEHRTDTTAPGAFLTAACYHQSVEGCRLPSVHGA